MVRNGIGQSDWFISDWTDFRLNNFIFVHLNPRMVKFEKLKNESDDTEVSHVLKYKNVRFLLVWRKNIAKYIWIDFNRGFSIFSAHKRNMNEQEGVN